MVRLNRTLSPFGWTLQVRPRRGCGWRLVPYQKEHDLSRREDQALALLRARRFCTPLEIGRAATRGEVRANRLTSTARQPIGLENSEQRAVGKAGVSQREYRSLAHP